MQKTLLENKNWDYLFILISKNVFPLVLIFPNIQYRLL